MVSKNPHLETVAAPHPHFAHGDDEWIQAADILFVTDSAELPAHSIIVRWLSAYFSGMLTDLASGSGGLMATPTATKIPLPDSSAEDVQLLPNYMYSRAPQQLVASLPVQQIEDLLQLADKYDINTAMADIDANLTIRVKTQKILQPHSVIKWAETAEACNLKQFLVACQEYVAREAAAVIKDPSFPGRLSASSLAPVLRHMAAMHAQQVGQLENGISKVKSFRKSLQQWEKVREQLTVCSKSQSSHLDIHMQQAICSHLISAPSSSTLELALKFNGIRHRQGHFQQSPARLGQSAWLTHGMHVYSDVDQLTLQEVEVC